MAGYLEFTDLYGDVIRVEGTIGGDTLLFTASRKGGESSMVDLNKEQVSELIDHLIKFRDYVKPIEVGSKVEWCGNPGAEFTVLSVIEEWAWIQYPHGDPCTVPLHQLKHAKQEA